MPADEGWTYAKAGLDLAAYARTMAGIQPMLARTWTPGVVPPPFPARPGGKGSGGFASLFDLNPDGKYRRPLLVTCTDGVGSKLKVAQDLRRFDTVGIDLVAMSVNDLICTGGEPLVFLDYLAMPKDDPDLTATLLRGISDGCVEAGCALVGGETAILPDSYRDGDFDLAGFAVGVVEKDDALDGSRIRPGDQLLALPSSGLHSNGYTLARRVAQASGVKLTDRVPELGTTLGEALLTPTRIYVKLVRKLLDSARVSGLANITGGGVPDNLGRILPPGGRAAVHAGSWPVPPIFDWIRHAGSVPDAEMSRVFNLGVGFIAVVPPDQVEAARAALGECHAIGEIVVGETGVAVVGR